MAVDEQSLAHHDTERKPAHLRPRQATDTVSVVAVLVASVAMIAALVAVGFAARAINASNQRLRQETVSAGTAATSSPAAAGAAAPAASTEASFDVTEHDFAISSAEPSVPAGLVALRVTDRGPTAHELLIFQTDL